LSRSQNTHAQPDASAQAIRRLPNGQWVKGVSGNPEAAKRYWAKQAAIAAYEAALLAAIIADLGKAKLTKLEHMLAQQAALELSKARYEKDAALRVRLSRSATSIIDRLRNGVEKRNPQPSLGTFRL
jgi:dsRNA-specific ribonuclease